MGGGDGVGSLMSIATELSKKLKEFPKKSQIVVICGHNKQVAKQITSKAWPPNINMVAKGFMSNTDEYMSERL
jgi:UDP-N-acetylglucosamine:LPS N-acetylglucosamine transferase